ncbi:MAG: hypothetical protein J0L52_10130 [Caulobacterales bacterium]|nr:hypothetical protein [Caulobacterales bacterium]
MPEYKAKFADHANELIAAAEEKPFVVFLFGPSLTSKQRASVDLRRRLKEALEAAKFEVVLGEDESVNNPTLKGIGINIQDSELEFARKYCNAIVLIADSVGSFCELGLFSWHFAHSEGVLSHLDFILLIDKKHAPPPGSYLNQGPALAVHGHGLRLYEPFKKFDIDAVVSRLVARRGTYTVEQRGRPRVPKAQ